MTNEEKAIDLAENISPYDIGGDNAAHYAAKDAALDAMEWKEQQIIDRFEDWLANNICNAYNFRGDNISSTFINDCIKACKEERDND